MTPNEMRFRILQALHTRLKPLGYRKSGSVFSRESEDVVHLIEVQGSRHNTSSESMFTVNAAVFARAAVHADIRDLTKPKVGTSHWRQRIGSLCPEQRDLWWTVHGASGAGEAGEEIALYVERYVLPTLQDIPNLRTLVALWKSGRSPGIPPLLREQFLNTVEAVA